MSDMDMHEIRRRLKEAADFTKEVMTVNLLCMWPPSVSQNPPTRERLAEELLSEFSSHACDEGAFIDPGGIPKKIREVEELLEALRKLEGENDGRD